MNDRTDSAKNPDPDEDKLWLKGTGAEVRFSATTEKRILDIVEAVRRRYAKEKRD